MDEGTPQGGPLSPLLSNLVLDELDRELERRGHRFVRYADDCNIYVRSGGAGQRVMKSVTGFITRRLKLKVNESKSAVARPAERNVSGLQHQQRKGTEAAHRAQGPAALQAEDTGADATDTGDQFGADGRDELASYLRGWKSYFGICETPSVLRKVWISGYGEGCDP